MKKIICILAICFTATGVWAQEGSLYTQYFINQFLINPAMAGFDDGHQLRMNIRSQWSGFSGAPTTYSLSYNGAIDGSSGVGITLLTDNVAAFTRYKAEVSYAYRIVGENTKVSMGVSGSYNSFSIPSSVFSNPLYDQNDLLIEDAVEGESFFDASVGIRFNFYDYYVGLSAPNLIRTRLEDIGFNQEGQLFRYFNFAAGAKFNVSQDGATVEPSILLRKVRNVPMQADISVLGRFLDEQFIAGLSARVGTDTETSVAVLVGTRITNLRLTYSYDIAFGRFEEFSSGSHEITIGIDFQGKQKWLKKENELEMINKI